MKVRALERCYHEQIREEGDVFEVPDDADLKDAPYERVEDEPKPKGRKPHADDSAI